MKTKTCFALLLTVAVALVAVAAEKIGAGPKGGRLLDATPQKAEFRVTADRRVEIAFYDAALKSVAPSGQIVAVIVEAPGGREALDVVATSEGFVSKDALPPGEPYRVVVQVKSAPDAKPQNFRIDLNLETCGECQRAEYACICDGH